jgi:lipoprotein-releasing system permease protein
VVAAAGVTCGIAMFIALVGFMQGLNQMLDDMFLNRTPHIRLYNEIRPAPVQPVELSGKYRHTENFIHSIKPKDRGKEIYNSQAILQALRADPRVAATTPRVMTPVFFTSGTIELGGVLEGLDPHSSAGLFSLSDYVIAGEWEDLDLVANSLFIGKGVADKMQVDIGDMIRVTTGKGQQALLKVAGIVQFGIQQADDIQSYSSLATAQKLLGQPASYITDIQVNLKDYEQAPATAREFSRTFGLEALDMQTANAEFETGNNVRSTISYAVGITLLIVAGFGIYNILNMMIYEKMDTIAILKATGFSGRDVRRIFLSLSLIIGSAGGLLGLALGYGLSVVLDHLPFETTSMPTIKTYPVAFNPAFYLIGLCFALLSTYLAGLLPARKASQADPVVIIRGK